MAQPPILFFDGVCGLCNHTVDMLLRLDRGGRLRFAPLQGVTAQEYLPATPSLPDAVLLLDTDGLHARSEALVRALATLGGGWRLVKTLRAIPRPLRDAAYDALARRRYRWFGRRDTCRVPSAEEQHRFLP
jgi:predicted DCC family thiol-disulfide oxidoreductase YuxK